MGRLWVIAAAIALCACGTAAADGPPPLSGDRSPADIASTHGSGIFGEWTADRWGLPAYRYTSTPTRDPRAAQTELKRQHATPGTSSATTTSSRPRTTAAT